MNDTILRVIVPDLEPYISYNGTSLFGPYGGLLASFVVWSNITLKITYQQCKTSSNYAKCRLVGPDGYPSVDDHHDLNMYPAAVRSYNKDFAITPKRNELCLIAPRGSLIYEGLFLFVGNGTAVFFLLFYSIVSQFFPRRRKRTSSLMKRMAYIISQSGTLKNVTMREKFALVLISVYSCYILSHVQNELCATKSTVRFYQDYKTIEEVRNAPLTIMVPESYKVGYSKLLQAHQNRFKFRFYNRSEFRFYKSSYAHLLSCFDAHKRVELDSNFDKRISRRIMAVVPEVFHTGFIGVRFRANSPFKKQFEQFSQNFFENGLMKKLTGGPGPSGTLISPEEFEIVTFFQFHPVLKLLGFEWLVVIVIFFGELLVRKRTKVGIVGQRRVVLGRHGRSKSEPVILNYNVSQIVCHSMRNGYVTD